MEADYDLGVLAPCATTSSTGTTPMVGQVCVPSNDSTLGGYCMDPLPPLTDGAKSRHLLKRFSDEGLFREVCEDKYISTTEVSLLSPIGFCQVRIFHLTFSVIPQPEQFHTIPVNWEFQLHITTHMVTMALLPGSKDFILFLQVLSRILLIPRVVAQPLISTLNVIVQLWLKV